MDAEDTGSGKEDEPEQEVTSEQEEEDGAGPSTSTGSNSQSNNRFLRNMAEKNRRDKLNFFINELSTLVPIISFSPKKLDKTSILRLAATFIRQHNVIYGPVRREKRSTAQTTVHRQMLEYLPQYLASFNWSEHLLEDMDGMLMIVNGAGRIIFISHTVEKLLGHTQIELMGQSLFKLSCLEDHQELTRNLSPNDEPVGEADSVEDESSNDSSSEPATPPPRPATLPFHLDSESSDNDQRLRRSFYIRLSLRAQSRSDQPQYELVHIVGHLRVPPRTRPRPSTSRRTKQQTNPNDVILVAVVKPFKEKRLTTLSLMEACREEFITRHTLDGRIIYTDHRISIVAGYLAEEVCGVPGFQYMHKDDMRWTMVGLRQMFFRGSSYGQSCYRLQSKNGTFIYLKTCGYLELSENNDSFQSLICINSLVTAVEGEALIRQMKDQYSPVIRNKNDKNMEILTSTIQAGRNEAKGETEDPKVLEDAISHMISDVGLHNNSIFHTSLDSPSPPIDSSELLKVAKAMPPLSIQIKKIGIVPPIIRKPASLASSLSPPSNHSHSPPMKASPPPPTPAPPTQQNRPSVLHVAPPNPSRTSVLKRMRTDEQGQGVVTAAPVTEPRSVVVSPTGVKRKSEEPVDWPLSVSVSPSVSSPSFAQPSPQFQLLTVDDNDYIPEFRILDDASSPLLPLEVMDLEEWGLPAVLESSHEGLTNRMQLQSEELSQIEENLARVPAQEYTTKLTQLQVEHRKQQQMLKTLQQDHQSIQHQLLGVCSSQQNMGVLE